MALRGWIDEHPGEPCSIGVDDRARPGLLRMFDGPTVCKPGGGVRIDQGSDAAVRADGTKTRLSRYCEAIGVSKPRIPPLLDSTRVGSLMGAYHGAVLIAPTITRSKYVCREWPIMFWAELCRRLLSMGRKVVALGDDAERLKPLPDTVERLVSLDAAPLVSVVLNSSLLIGQDSGLSHLAGLLGSPCLVLIGPTNGAAIYSPYPSVRWVDGKLPCQGCWWHPPYTYEACGARGCASLATVTVDEVLGSVLSGGV